MPERTGHGDAKVASHSEPGIKSCSMSKKEYFPMVFPWFSHGFLMVFLCFFLMDFPMVFEMLFETVNICDIHRTNYVSEVLLTFTQDAHTVSEDSPIVMTCYDFGEL